MILFFSGLRSIDNEVGIIPPAIAEKSILHKSIIVYNIIACQDTLSLSFRILSTKSLLFTHDFVEIDDVDEYVHL